MSSQTPSPEQQQVIDIWGEGLAVLAGAGSGKTTTLVSKCIRLTELNPKARFAAVSFTERSASDLRSKLSERMIQKGEPGALNYHWVMTIHGLCGAIIQEYPKEAGFDGEETVLTEAESRLLWESALESMWLDEIPPQVSTSLDSLLDRESRMTLEDLLRRVRELSAFGALEFLKESLDPGTKALYDVSEFVIERYRRLKRRRGVLDFNDLELGADRALNHSSVCENFHKKFDLVLVDEFQDTNPVQARLVWKFVRPEGTNLCVVGDPKQSIYRFRDADVSVFEEFCKRLPHQQSLTWNFRSRPGIIHFANQVCAKTFADSPIQFESLIPQRADHPNLEPVLKVHIQSPSDLARWILKEVEKGIPLEDMALLVRRIRGNEKWFKTLMANGIPIAIGSGGLFWDDPRVRELVAFLRWWDNPGHSFSGGVFLRAPWMEIPDPILDQWIGQDPSWRVPFFDSEHPIALKLKGFLNQPARPGELLLALLVSEEIEAELWVPLMGLWHRVEEFSAQGLDFHETVVELTRALEEGRREREVPAPRGMGQLSVLTFHGAKGLEFPHVILIDFGPKSRSANAPLLFWDRNQGAFLGIRDEDGQRDKNHPQEVAWRALEKEKELAESKRVFYVALTRARERLVLICSELQESSKPKEVGHAPASSTLFKEDYWRGWIDHAGVEVAELEWLASDESVESREAKFTSEQSIAAKLSAAKLSAAKLSAAKLSAAKLPSADLELNSRSVLFKLPVQQKRARHSVTEWTLLSHCPRAYEWTFIRPHCADSGEVLDPELVVDLDQSFGQSFDLSFENDSDSNPDLVFSEDQMTFSFDLENEMVNESNPVSELNSRSVPDECQGIDLKPQEHDPKKQQELGTRVHQCLERGRYDQFKVIETEYGKDRFNGEAVLKWAENSPLMLPSDFAKGREVWTEMSFEIPIHDKISNQSETLVGSIDRLVLEVKKGEARATLIDFKVAENPKSTRTILERYQTQIELYAAAVKAMEPQLEIHQIDARVVHISSSIVQSIAIPIGKLDLQSLLRKALEIIDGASGEPSPGNQCRNCQFEVACGKTAFHNP